MFQIYKLNTHNQIYKDSTFCRNVNMTRLSQTIGQHLVLEKQAGSSNYSIKKNMNSQRIEGAFQMWIYLARFSRDSRCRLRLRVREMNGIFEWLITCSSVDILQKMLKLLNYLERSKNFKNVSNPINSQKAPQKALNPDFFLVLNP